MQVKIRMDLMGDVLLKELEKQGLIEDLMLFNDAKYIIINSNHSQKVRHCKESVYIDADYPEMTSSEFLKELGVPSDY